jgi:hypothetical protein
LTITGWGQGLGYFPKPVKIALRTRDKVAQNQEEIFRWMKHPNPGLNTKHWRVMDKAPEPNSQRLILLKERDSYTITEETGYKIFTGFLQGTNKVLRDTETKPQQGEWAALEGLLRKYGKEQKERDLSHSLAKKRE